MFKKDGSLEVKSGKIRWDIPSYPLSVGPRGALDRIQHETAPSPWILGKLRLMEVGSSYHDGNLMQGKKQRARMIPGVRSRLLTSLFPLEHLESFLLVTPTMLIND